MAMPRDMPAMGMRHVGRMGPSPLHSRIDARQIACRAFGVHLLSDIHERGCEWRLPLPIGAARRRRIARIAETGLLFVHIPKAAGTSISQALYGFQVKHASIRLSRRVAGGRLARLPSFAVLRDPVDRFVSAWRYGRAGGSTLHSVADSFRALYQGFATIEQALDHVEAARTPYAVDHIFRQQSWYVSDDAGGIGVDRLLTTKDIARLPALIPGFPDRPVPHLNGSATARTLLTAEQYARLRKIYAADFALWEQVQAGRFAAHTLPSPVARPRRPRIVGYSGMIPHY
jgi:hypothetical protein